MADSPLSNRKDVLGGGMTPEEQRKAILKGFRPFWVEFAWFHHTAGIEVWAKSEGAALEGGATMASLYYSVMSMKGTVSTLRGFCTRCSHSAASCTCEEAVQDLESLPPFEVDWEAPAPASGADQGESWRAAYARRAGLK